MTDVLAAQRRDRLIDELRKAGGFKVTELAVLPGVSQATVRRRPARSGAGGAVE